MERCLRILVLAAVLGVAAVPWRAELAAACFCEPRPPAEHIVPESIVFRGTVTDVGSSVDGATRYTFEPTIVWRGELPEPLYVYDVGSCAAQVDRGGEYLVSTGADQHGDLRISICHLVRPLSAGPLPDDLAFLGPGRAVTPRARDSPQLQTDPLTDSGLQDNWPRIALLAATSLAAAAATLAIARRR